MKTMSIIGERLISTVSESLDESERRMGIEGRKLEIKGDRAASLTELVFG